MIQGVDRAYWYYWDTPNSLIGITLQYGTTGSIGYQTAYMWMNNSYYTCTKGAVNVCQMGDATQPDAVVWSNSGSGTYTVPANATVQCDAMNRCTTVIPGTSIAIGSMPLWFGSEQQNGQNQATLVPSPATTP